MGRFLIGLVGSIAAVFPDRMLDLFEQFAVENPREGTPKPWIGSAIRTEGVIVVLASLVGGRAYAWMMNITGIFGAIIVAAPDLYRRFAIAFLYEDSDVVKWDDRFTTGVRIIGLLYVLLAAVSFRKRQTGETASAEQE